MSLDELTNIAIAVGSLLTFITAWGLLDYFTGGSK
jgi:hypothetical protein